MMSTELLFRSGDLRHVITFQTPAKVQRTSGAIKSAPWTDFVTTRAQILPLGGSERFSAEQYTPESTFIIKLRFYPGITTEMRVVFGTRTFDILNINNVEERDRVLFLSCREGRSKQDI